MRYIKISNLLNGRSNCDYKGLDINRFVPGFQLYDVEENDLAYIATTDNNFLIKHRDLLEITEAEYNNAKAEIQNRPRPLTEFERLEKKVADQDMATSEYLLDCELRLSLIELGI